MPFWLLYSFWELLNNPNIGNNKYFHKRYWVVMLKPNLVMAQMFKEYRSQLLMMKKLKALFSILLKLQHLNFGLED